MAFTVEDLSDLFRVEMEDTEEDFLFSSEQVFEFMNEAQREFARDTKIFSSERSLVAVTALSPIVDMPATSFQLRRAQLASQGLPLSLANFIDMDYTFISDDYANHQIGDWLNSTGTPKVIISDMITDKFRLAPTPLVADTLTLHTWDYPDTDIEDEGSSFSLVDTRHQRSLLLYMRHLAYRIHDAETFDLELSASFKADWDIRIAKFISELRNRRRRGRGTVRYGGIDGGAT